MDPFRSDRSRVLRRSSGPSPWLLHLSVANGFPPETYLPFLDALASLMPEPIDAFSILPQALWKVPGRPEDFGSWEDGADELRATLEQLGAPSGLVGVGHSFGAVMTALAAVREPSRFRAMVWLDPTLFTPVQLFGIRLARALRPLGLGPRVPVVEAALRRRNRFASPGEALDYFHGRKVFRGWDDRALRQYVEWGLKETPSGWVLAWDPAWEARYFATVEPSVWSRLAGISRRIPVLVVRGSESDVFCSRALRHLQTLGLDLSVRELSGQGHLFPQTAPEAAAKIVAQWLGSIGRGGLSDR